MSGNVRYSRVGAVKLGSEYANPDYNPKAGKVKYPYIEKDAEIYVIGADPGGLGYSKFGLCMVGLFDSKIHVFTLMLKIES